MLLHDLQVLSDVSANYEVGQLTTQLETERNLPTEHDKQLEALVLHVKQVEEQIEQIKFVVSPK